MNERYIAVVGAVNVDIWGRSYEKLIPRDSNPGEVRISLGGVGRNICHNLRLLNVKVQFLTAIGRDIWARQIEQGCRELGIGLDRAVFVSDGRTSSYLCITGPDGDLSLGLSDTDVARHITPEVIERNLDMLNGARAVVFDGNLTAEAMGALTQYVSAPLFADPVSVTKAKKLIPFLDKIHTVKPNTMEAEVLTGETVPEKAAAALVRLGVKRAFVSDGPRGIVTCEGGETVRFPCFDCKLVNATGGGDASMAALCRAFLDGADIAQSALYALAAGSVAVACGETINPALSMGAVKQLVAAARPAAAPE